MKSKKKAAMALVLCILFLCTMLFILTTTTPTITSPLTTGQKTDYPQLKNAITDPTIQINGRYYNINWFQIQNATVTETIENSTTDPPVNLTISWNIFTNHSVAMSFNTTNTTTYFNGVQLYIGYNLNVTLPDLRVELRNGTLYNATDLTSWVPSNATDAILLSREYEYGNFTSSGDWVTLLNDTTIKLIPRHTYFVLLRLSSDTSDNNESYYSWRCTPDTDTGSDGVNEGITRDLNFTSIYDLNDTRLWSLCPDQYDCWMMVNFTKLQYTLQLQLPANWTLNQLSVDVFNSSTEPTIGYYVSGSLEGNITGGSGTFIISNITDGDRMYLAVIKFTNIKAIPWSHIIEDEYNSEGFVRTVGNISEAQRFTLPKDVENLSISIWIRNKDLTENLTAEIWNATLDTDIGAYYPSTNISEVALEIPYGNVTTDYDWLTLNFTGNFSQGNYFLVIHTKNWTGDPSGSQFYDWGSHTSVFEIPPPEGYEIWTSPDNSSNWNWKDVRDPYGHRYWHCMIIQYNYSPNIKDINLAVNYELVGDNGVWNGTVWIPIPANKGYNVTFDLNCYKDISYNLDYTIYYYNYTNNLSNETAFYIFDKQMTPSGQSYWYQSLNSTEARYNISTGIATLVFTAFNTTSEEWISTTVNASISALMSHTNTSEYLDTTFTNIYPHSGATISLSQESTYIYYNSTTNTGAVSTIFLNSTTTPLSGNWTDAYISSITKLVKILKNAFDTTSVGQEISDGEEVNTTVTFYTKVNITSPIIPYFNTSVTLNITNVLDNPDYLNVSIIRPNGTIENNNGTKIDTENWNYTFTPKETGKYIISITTSTGGITIRREIGNQAAEQYYYILNVYQLGTGLLELDTGDKLAIGVPYNLKIWVRYLPYNASETPQVNVTNLTVYLNGEPHNATGVYNNNTGIAELLITPNSLGDLNITLEATDNESRNITKSFTIQVVPQTLPTLPILGLLTVSAAIGQFDMDTLSRIATIVLWLLIAGLIFMRAFYPDTLIRIHKKVSRKP